jgi:hypothetical protein
MNGLAVFKGWISRFLSSFTINLSLFQRFGKLPSFFRVRLEQKKKMVVRSLYISTQSNLTFPKTIVH